MKQISDKPPYFLPDTYEYELLGIRKTDAVPQYTPEELFLVITEASERIASMAITACDYMPSEQAALQRSIASYQGWVQLWRNMVSPHIGLTDEDFKKLLQQ